MSFADLVGHEPAIRLLKGQIARDRLAQTYLFTGPEGIGKQALAAAFAAELGCGPHDLLVVKSELESGDIGIDSVRAMEAWMSLTPYGGKRKAAVLDSAEKLTEESANACLKILEEPPARSLFILLASAAYRLPATLLSRCHRIRCSPQGIEKVSAALREREGLDPAAARMLAICSGGRYGLALQFHKTGRLAELNEALDQILSALKRKELETPLARSTRKELQEYLEWYAGWCRDLMVLSVGGDPDWVIHRDRLDELRSVVARSEATKQSSSAPAALISQADRAYEVREAIRRNASVKTALSVLLSHG